MPIELPKARNARWWVRLLGKIPFLTKTCPFGVTHWRWNDFCSCGFLRPQLDIGWHGGVYDLASGAELNICAQCNPQFGIVSHIWHLSVEEETLIGSWRVFEDEILSLFGEDRPYRYDVYVEINEMRMRLMERNQGVVMDGPKPKSEEEKPN